MPLFEGGAQTASLINDKAGSADHDACTTMVGD
jgi:hypothetical protein